MNETTNKLHNESAAWEKHHSNSLLITEIIAWICFIAFLFASYFGLKYAHTCEIQSKVISKQQEIIQCYKSQSIMVNDYIKKGEIEILKPKHYETEN